MAAVVAVLAVDIHVSEARSLKDRRAVVRSIKDRLRRLNVSVAETDPQALHQRCHLDIAAAGGTRTAVEQLLRTAEDEIVRRDPRLLAHAQVEWLT